MNDYISFPSLLAGFVQNIGETVQKMTRSDRVINCIRGSLREGEGDRICPHCGSPGHIHGSRETELRHLPFGGALTSVSFGRNRYSCPCCQRTWMQCVPFKADGHFITAELRGYAESLLAYGLTLKEVSEITGLGKNIVKDIDKARLEGLYTMDGKALRKPERQARHLGIDEFKLHDGHRYATVIIDLETGHVLWLSHGRKKRCVYEFIEHVGEEWMDGVEAVACDMNSDYQEAFEQRCEHITVVFDFFHIVKNLNEKVISEVRKDEQRRLCAEGRKEEARSLKRSKYILCSSHKTLEDKDEEAGRTSVRASALFGREEKKAKGGNVERYQALIRDNRLLFTADLVKEMLSSAYAMADEAEMAGMIADIMDICDATGNEHFRWFSRLLDNHFEGIIAHATYRISSGKVEGINNKIKTIRRQGYGYPDDDYFFLKIFDASRKPYVMNPKSHKIRD